jgi:hypothetical protein
VLRVRHVAKVVFTLSKIANVNFAVTLGGVTSSIDTSLVPHGRHYFVWRPARPGMYTITLSAVDLAGNKAAQTASVTVAG